MSSVFYTPLPIHRMFDLKGSRAGRSATPEERAENKVMKDNDLIVDGITITLGPNKPQFVETLKNDSEWLASHKIMDYSLLLGIHHEGEERGKASTVSTDGRQGYRTMSVQLTENEMNRQQVLSSVASEGETRAQHNTNDMELSPSLSSEPSGSAGLSNNVFCRDEGGIRARLPPDEEGGDTFVDNDIYFLGIIDILQQYNTWKKSENFLKGFTQDRKQISAVPPKDYALRFVKFFDSNSK